MSSCPGMGRSWRLPAPRQSRLRHPLRSRSPLPSGGLQTKAVGVDVLISGGDFRETIHVSDEPVTMEVPGPGTYLFQIGGVLEASTGPTTGCWWYGEPVSVEVTSSQTVSLRADQVCA